MEAAVAFRFVLATVFVLAGLAKLTRRRAFARAIDRYEILPETLVRPAAALIPPLELAAGILLAIGLGTAPVAIVLGALLAVFSVAIAVNLLRGRSFDCGCFTPGVPTTIGWSNVLRNAVLMGMAAVVASWQPAALAVDGAAFGAHTGLSSSDAFALAVCASVAVLVSTAVGEGVKALRLTRKVLALGVERR